MAKKKSNISSTMKTTIKGILEIQESGEAFFVTEDARYSFADVYGKYNNEQVDCVLTLKEDEE